MDYNFIECDICGYEIFEGESYYEIVKKGGWTDKNVCESCSIEKHYDPTFEDDIKHTSCCNKKLEYKKDDDEIYLYTSSDIYCCYNEERVECNNLNWEIN